MLHRRTGLNTCAKRAPNSSACRPLEERLAIAGRFLFCGGRSNAALQKMHGGQTETAFVSADLSDYL